MKLKDKISNCGELQEPMVLIECSSLEHMYYLLVDYPRLN